MKHAKTGTLRAYLDGQLDSGQGSAVEQHFKSCAVCERELATLSNQAATVHERLDRLPGIIGRR